MSATARLGDRSLFPSLTARAYLNHAAVSPWSLPVQRAVPAAAADDPGLGGGGILTPGQPRGRRDLRAAGPARS